LFNILNLVIVSTLVWIAQDQFQRIDLVPHQVSLVMLSAVLALFAAWVAWQARGHWRPAAVGVVALTIGMQVGRFLSDVISGINWSGSDYWWFWGSAWSFLLAINTSLVLLLLFPIGWVQRRRRDA
jgi:hypothetical protein